MVLVQTYGKPSLFITITCNRKWYEIVSNIGEDKEVIDRPDIVARVFYQKVKELKDKTVKKKVVKSIALTYVTEFQKRGLAHMRMLVFLAKEDKLFNVDLIYDIVSAESADINKQPRLYIVKQFIVDGPCII